MYLQIQKVIELRQTRTDLQSSFFSLRYAKSIGKNKIVVCENKNQYG
jgi:hypothetical protein